MLNNPFIEFVIFSLYITHFITKKIIYNLKSKKNIFIKSIFKEKDVIYSIHEGLKKLGKNLCVFSYYQPNGLKKTTIEYLRHLSEDCNYSICLVSTSRINDKDLEILKKYCFEVIIKSNTGYDFGSYKVGVLRHENKKDELENILIANDSVIAPLFSMKELFKIMNEENKCDFWGIGDNFCNIDYHIVSCFINFKHNIIKSGLLFAFFQQYKAINDRKYTIHKGEIAMSKYFYKHGFHSDALVSCNKIYSKIQEDPSIIIQNKNIFSLNFILRSIQFSNKFSQEINNFLTDQYFHYFHLILIKEFKLPFIKRDCLGKNGVLGLYNTFREPQLAYVLDNIQIETNITKEDILLEFRQR